MKYKSIILSAFIIFIVKFALSQSVSLEKNSNIAYSLSKVREDSIFKQIIKLENFNTRFALAENRKEVALYIGECFKNYGCDATIDSFFCSADKYPMRWPLFFGDTYETWQYNVIAVYNSATKNGENIILGAHYDAMIYPLVDSLHNPFNLAPGADDNASGVTYMLELARVLHTENIQLNFPLKFVAFGAEEFGLYGSKHYVKTADSLNENIKLMINYDMVGYNKAPLENWILLCERYDGNDSVINFAKEIAKTYTYLTIKDTMQWYKQSDSYPFFNSNYKTIFFHENDNYPYYHQNTDTYSKIDVVYLAEAIRVSLGMLLTYNNSLTSISIPNKTSNIHVSCYPSPFSNEINIQYFIPENDIVKIGIYDLFGRQVESIMNEAKYLGRHQLKYDTKHLKNGLYICVLSTSKFTTSIKIIKQ